MSSAKDYVLDIIPPITDGAELTPNAVKFTVRHRNSSNIIKYRLVFISILLVTEAILISRAANLGEIEDLLDYILAFKKWDNHIIVILAINFVILILCLRQESREEMIVMKDTGIQLVSKGPWRYQTNSENFIPLNKIIDLVIHEGFQGHASVIFYLCILLKPDSNKDNEILKVVFPKFLPRKNIVVEVWKLSKSVLFGRTKQYWRRVPGKGLRQLEPT